MFKAKLRNNHEIIKKHYSFYLKLKAAQQCNRTNEESYTQIY